MEGWESVNYDYVILVWNIMIYKLNSAITKVMFRMEGAITHEVVTITWYPGILKFNFTATPLL